MYIIKSNTYNQNVIYIYSYTYKYTVKVVRFPGVNYHSFRSFFQEYHESFSANINLYVQALYNGVV